MERLKKMKETLMCAVESEINGDLKHVDTKELGEAIDMIKDLEEAMYYCSIVKAMEESKDELGSRYYTTKYIPGIGENWKDRYRPKYRDMDRDYGTMYYTEMNMGPDTHGGMGGGIPKTYYDPDMLPKLGERDYREGRSPMRRKTYIEGKELHKDKTHQMEELEKYIQELGEDLADMVREASPEEKTLLQQKISTLATKIK